MQITDFEQVDKELHNFLLDFVFSVRSLTEAQGCLLKITNNVLNVVFISGKIDNNPSVEIATKERTHINCLLQIYKPENKIETNLKFHLKSELEILRKLIETKLQLFFREKWQEKGFFFEYEEDEKDFKEICESLKNYINQFIDIELIGVSYLDPEEEEIYAVEKRHRDSLYYFSKSVFSYLKNKHSEWIQKEFADYYLIGRKVPRQFLSFLFKGEPHPIYFTAINFMLNELLMLFSSIKWLNAQKKALESVIKGFISSLEAKDVYTRGHSEGVAFYSLEIGKSLGLTSEELKKLEMASLLHDIGKVGIPDCILLKPESLSEMEYNIVKLHSVIGAEIINKISDLSEFTLPVKHHHERWDGKGYPDGIKGEDIPLFARIIAIADAFDAMLSERVYRPSKSKKDALRELEVCSGTQFDPYIVKKSIKRLSETDIFSPASLYFIPKSVEEARKGYYLRDTLTGAKNLEALVSDLKGKTEVYNFLFLDIKNFYFYNIVKGYKEGNNLLIKLYQNLCYYFTEEKVYRVGADEFLIASQEPFDREELKKIIKELEEKTGIKISFYLKSIDLRDIYVRNLINEFKLEDHYNSILMHYFEVLRNFFHKVVVYDTEFNVISMCFVSKNEAEEYPYTKKLKPLFYEEQIIGYAFVE